MKKLLFILVLFLFALSACGNNIHENVDEDVAKDARQVVNTIIENVENKIPIAEVSDEDNDLFESYYKKYIENEDTFNSAYKGATGDVVAMASASLVKYSKGINLDSEKQSLLDNQELMEKIITTGKAVREE